MKLPIQEAFITRDRPNGLYWKVIKIEPLSLDAASVSGLSIPFSTLPLCKLPAQEELSRADKNPVVDALVVEILALGAVVCT